MTYFFYKTVLSIICDKCNRRDGKIFKEKESIQILKILGLIKEKHKKFLKN